MSKKSRANKTTSPGRYTGDLATPIYEPVACVVGGLGGSKAEAERRAAEQQILKMEKLFEWYSIDWDEPDAAAMLLAVKLALAHVPGMQVRFRKRGRKPSWKDGLGIELVRDVDALRQSKKMNNSQAIDELRKDKGKPWWRYSRDNLITRHREARKVEQDRRRVAEQFKASPMAQAMGTIFRVGLTDENSNDQN